MPKFAIYSFITFFVYYYDILKERPHLHFYKGKRLKDIGKIWLDNFEIVYAGNFSKKELNLTQKLVKKYQKELLLLYDKAKKQEKFSPIQMTLE